MESGNHTAQRKSEPAAPFFPAAGFVNHIKGFCHTPEVFGRDAVPFVFYGNAVFFSCQIDSRTGGTGLNGVFFQIDQETFKKVGIEKKLPYMSVSVELYLFFVQVGPFQSFDPGKEVRDICFLQPDTFIVIGADQIHEFTAQSL